MCSIRAQTLSHVAISPQNHLVAPKCQKDTLIYDPSNEKAARAECSEILPPSCKNAIEQADVRAWRHPTLPSASILPCQDHVFSNTPHNLTVNSFILKTRFSTTYTTPLKPLFPSTFFAHNHTTLNLKHRPNSPPSAETPNKPPKPPRVSPSSMSGD
jgi:hypothetical protein